MKKKIKLERKKNRRKRRKDIDELLDTEWNEEYEVSDLEDYENSLDY